MSVVEEVLINLNEEKMKELNELIKSCEIELNYVEERILSSNDAYLLYLAGIHIEWLNKGRIAHALSRTGDSFYILRYAWYINKLEDSLEKNNIIKDLAKGISRTKDVYNIYYFARDIKDAPLEKLIRAISKTNNPQYIYYTLRDFNSKISLATKLELVERLIELKDSLYIFFASNIVPEIPITEYANAMLNSEINAKYYIHLCMFYKSHQLPEGKLRDLFISSILESNNYRLISNLIIESNNVPYDIMINYLLEKKPKIDFYLKFILPIAISNKACSYYAVDKIIESHYLELITITIYYMEDEILRLKLQDYLSTINEFNEKLEKLSLTEEVKLRVRKVS